MHQVDSHCVCVCECVCVCAWDTLCDTLLHTPQHTLQHTATHSATRDMYKEAPGEPHTATHWHRHSNKDGMSILTCPDTKGNFCCLEKRMRICYEMCATAYNTLEHATAHCNTLQCVFAMICVEQIHSQTHTHPHQHMHAHAHSHVRTYCL